jgi:hypothetical protein
VVRFTPRRFTSGERVHNTHWIGDWVDPRAGLDDTKKLKSLTPPGFELRPLDRPSGSQSLYRLRCLVQIVLRLRTVEKYDGDILILRSELCERETIILTLFRKTCQPFVMVATYHSGKSTTTNLFRVSVTIYTMVF